MELKNQYKSRNLKVLIPIKQVPNPYAPITIKPDHSTLETSGIKWIMNPYDEIALATAIELKQQANIGEIIVIYIGNNYKEILLPALARGADQAIVIETNEDTNFLSPLNIAKILQYIVIEQQIELVILGKQAIDFDFSQTGQMLAGLLDWPQACCASKIMLEIPVNNQIIHNINKVIVTCETDLGINNVTLQLPAIITVDLYLPELPRISLSQLLNAKHKPVITRSIDELIANIPTLKFNQLKLLNVAPPPAAPIGIKIDNIQELIRLLATKEEILR